MASQPQPPDPPLTDLEQELGYRFTDSTLLETALTHSSFSVENGDVPSYERLEFLGDAVLELVTTEIIYVSMPAEREGPMTKLRASVVDSVTLGDVGRQLGLGRWIRLGIGEERSGGADRDSILSDVVESILGAMFLDGGLEPVTELITRLWAPRISENIASAEVTDARSQLQELLAQNGRVVEFRFVRSGPDHAVMFDAEAVVDGAVIGSGTAGSKKSAAIEASADALASFTSEQ